ncbi:hypothetical protein PR202_gb16010 [Eleusine coracana subsp. coracana]|uniref:Uncharacterized protein n=1 Tax=Eleusine coracana subsp. coracana TaxID=191504 RepID=A0AAV5EZH6_ELECO|nr:hypothetical protein PR202_gb16010 [Eleusine coracana subsp. coracana]
MSLGYAKKLSYREEIGEVGMPEIFDSSEILQNKIEELAAMVQKVGFFAVAHVYTSTVELCIAILLKIGFYNAEYLRDFEIETIGLKDTPRRCSDKKCGARLKDTVLDWEDALPTEEMNSAKEHCRTADLVLCLGTRTVIVALAESTVEEALL